MAVAEVGRTTEAALSVRGLSIDYRDGVGGMNRAVDGVSIDVPKGSILGIVGESGCGKSSVALALLGLHPKRSTITSGQVLLGGENIVAMSERQLRRVRGRRISMIFQDPMTSLDPSFTVGSQVASVARRHLRVSRRDSWERAIGALRKVGIPDPERVAKDFPHRLSGGMRQRVMIAAAMVCEPEMLIADEPTTALDVTVQAQVLELLCSLQRDRHLSVVLITHDLRVVSQTCDHIAVMYAGEVVESGPSEEVFATPRHPYTKALLSSLSGLGDKSKPLTVIPGRVPLDRSSIVGCRFRERCAVAVEVCRSEHPELAAGPGGVHVRCWLAGTGTTAHPDGERGSGPWLTQ